MFYNLYGAIYVRRYTISYYAHVTLAHVNCKLRKIVSEDDLDIQRAARKGIDVKLACPRVLYAPSEREIEDEWKKRVRRSPLPLHAKIPAVFWDDESREKKTAHRIGMCLCSKLEYFVENGCSNLVKKELSFSTSNPSALNFPGPSK